MKRKKYAYLFATTVLLANVATTPITVIAETMQENSSSEVAEKAEKQEKNQEEPLNSSEQDTSESDNETAEYTNNTQQQEDSSTPIEQAPSQPNNNESTQDNTKIESDLEKEIVETSDDLKEAKVQDWKVEENDDYVLLVRYEGDNKNLVVPNEINGKPTKLKGINEGVIPNLKSLEGFTVRPSTTGQMVGLDNTSLVGAFSGSTIVSINLSGLDTSQVTDMTNMFSSCSKLTSLDLSSFNTSQVTSMEGMFSGCSGLTSLDVSKFDTSAVTSMEGMFSGCSSLSSLDVSKFNTSQVTSMTSMFNGCSSLSSLDVSNFVTGAVTSMINMFNGCSSLSSLDVSKFNTSAVTSMESMFAGCSGLTRLDVSKFVTKKVLSTSNMFADCSGLTRLNVSNFDTSAVLNMSAMFANCSGLTSLNVSNFDTSAVTQMNGMFTGCSGLTSLNVSSVSFKTDKVTEMTDMFAGCSGLTSLDVSRFNTSEVKSMDGMFSDCTGLKSLDLSSFNTGKVTKMTYMFAYCNSLTYLDLSNFDMSQVSQMDVMFLADEELPLLVKTNDSKLLSYDYSADLRYPGGPKFEANGGSFSPDSKEETKYYFEKCAVPVDSPKFALATFNEFRNNLKPTKEGNVFSRWKVTSGSEPVNDEQLLSPVTYMAQWRTGETGGVNIPSQDVDNTKPGEISSYGIAYMPKQFQTNRTVLNDAGPQSIPVNKTERFDVGVQDLRNTTSQWTLKAQLMWDGGKELPGSSIKTTNKTGVVMKNINNGTDPFNPDMDLTDSNNEVQGESDVTITNVPTLIMTANNVSHNAVYNYNLGDVSLEIPETRMIQPGSYEGHVEWNLANTL
ncbi:BspA family leucine-rich repeat surface protein [Enterococcus faecalis]|uniref:BspA family leucine-rich repeat surface protein n=1 Tax=Enterococcus faecalis TaxID=1351 RepID=UPI001F5B12AD|nr:BspA family leucine-rich repeat surface protein [Enterococcus faecalis]UNQ07331.1 BspA family leucine-rich repeat surface protein [Enterococcus faecalis]HDL6566321.1 BspA family leucine-rich repeat surface protein [Enterococcus faecalis]